MMGYTKLVKALRCKRDDCEGCDLAFFDKDEGWMCQYAAKDDDAADAIEALEKQIDSIENEKTNLEADIINLEIALDKANTQLPKRGEWIWIQRTNGGQYKGCSVCHAPIPTDSMLDYLDDEDCDFCYSCGAKMMEVQDDKA